MGLPGSVGTLLHLIMRSECRRLDPIGTGRVGLVEPPDRYIFYLDYYITHIGGTVRVVSLGGPRKIPIDLKVKRSEVKSLWLEEEPRNILPKISNFINSFL